MRNKRARAWALKYEPETLDEMVLSDQVRTMLQKVHDELPNTILFGGHGVGKTLFASKILAKTHDMVVIPPDIEAKQSVIDLIDGVSKTYPGRFVSRKRRFVYFNEAASLSCAAVMALHELLEDENRRCKFILCYNFASRFDLPLKSHMDVVHMQPAPMDKACEYLEDMLVAEKVDFERKDIELLVSDVWNSSDKGDMRMLVHRLQQTCVEGVLRYAYLREVVTPEMDPVAVEGAVQPAQW